MKFFFDENTSPNVAEGLKGFGEPVMYVTDRFSRGTQDRVLLQFVAENDMVFVTRDNRVRFNPLELVTIKDYGVGAVILKGKEMNRWNQIRQIIKAWPRIVDLSGKTPKPFALCVRFHGKVEPLALP
jgi:predicted nuclease of predicted toxin-antitoxin system